MNRLEVAWCTTPNGEDEEDSNRYIQFRITEEWFAVDNDQLILPITILERDGTTLSDPIPSILKQYGGEGLLNDMLLSDEDLEKGSEWIVETDELNGRTVYPVPSSDD